jgi:hypothetical protein
MGISKVRIQKFEGRQSSMKQSATQYRSHSHQIRVHNQELDCPHPDQISSGKVILKEHFQELEKYELMIVFFHVKIQSPNHKDFQQRMKNPVL